MSTPEQRTDSVDLEAAALLLVRRTHGELVRMVGHEHPLTVRIWEAIAAENARQRVAE